MVDDTVRYFRSCSNGSVRSSGSVRVKANKSRTYLLCGVTCHPGRVVWSHLSLFDCAVALLLVPLSDVGYILDLVVDICLSLAYLIIVTDATDGVSVNFFCRCKVLQI